MHELMRYACMHVRVGQGGLPIHVTRVPHAPTLRYHMPRLLLTTSATGSQGVRVHAVIHAHTKYMAHGT